MSERHYSTDNSAKFWKRVNRIPRNEGGETAYMLGVILQDLEERVLHYIETYERRRKNQKAKER